MLETELIAFFGLSAGPAELALLFVAVLILFGAKRLPELARTMGKVMGELRKASQDFKDQLTDIQSDVTDFRDEIMQPENSEHDDYHDHLHDEYHDEHHDHYHDEHGDGTEEGGGDEYQRMNPDYVDEDVAEDPSSEAAHPETSHDEAAIGKAANDAAAQTMESVARGSLDPSTPENDAPIEPVTEPVTEPDAEPEPSESATPSPEHKE